MFEAVKSDSGELNNMKEYLCLNINEAVTEVEACKAYVAECQKTGRKEVSLAKAALRSAERELRDWQNGIVRPWLKTCAGDGSGCWTLTSTPPPPQRIVSVIAMFRQLTIFS